MTARRPRALVVATLIVATVVIAAGLWLCRPPPAGPRQAASLGELVAPGDATGFNLVLVTLDTVRRDRLGCYGYQQAITPVCDGLLRHGVLFADAMTSAPITLPAHASLLTGLTPPRHGARDNGSHRLAEAHVTLAEILADHGYDTAAFVGCFVLDARFGLDQGFAVYDFEPSVRGVRPEMPDFNERDARAVSDAAIDWLRERQQSTATSPFFLWVHYFDPHLPYRSPLEQQAELAGRPYDAEIAFADLHLGRLLDELDRLGLDSRTLVVLVADHGEALGEHGEPTHGMLLHEATVRVPMLLSSPTLFDGSFVIDNQVVGIVDLKPTIEDLLGIEPPSPSDGRSLLRLEPDPARAIYVETVMPRGLAGWSPLYGLRTHHAKYVLAPEPELYDLVADPAESANLARRPPAALSGLAADLRRRLNAAASAPVSSRHVNDEERARLQALGYLPAARHTDPDTARPDPKTMMPTYNAALRAEGLYGQRKYAEALELTAQVLEQAPDLVLAQRVHAFSLLRLGRGNEAAELLADAADRGGDVFLLRSLVQVLILEQRFAEAESVLERYQAVDPSDGRVALLRGDIHARSGRPSEALQEYRRAIELDEHRTGPTARQRIERLEQQ